MVRMEIQTGDLRGTNDFKNTILLTFSYKSKNDMTTASLSICNKNKKFYQITYLSRLLEKYLTLFQLSLVKVSVALANAGTPMPGDSVGNCSICPRKNDLILAFGYRFCIIHKIFDLGLVRFK